MSTRMRIGGALLVGAGIILGTVILRPMPSENAAAVVEAVDTQETQRAYVSNTDSDGDGVQDWEEELNNVVRSSADDLPEFGSDENVQDDSFTSEFSRTFFEDYLRTQASGDMTAEETDAFIQKTIARAASKAKDTPLTRKDIIVGEDSPLAAREYGNAVAAALAPYAKAEPENELEIFERAVTNDDADAYAQLTNIANTYKQALTATLKIPAPPDYVGAHLALVNAYQAVANNTAAMADAQTDPIYALLRVGNHPADVAELQKAYVRIYERIHESGVKYANSEPASLFNELVE